MLERLFGRQRGLNRAITHALYAEIVAAARNPLFYSRWNAPDTPLGRFEMLSLHLFLVIRRMRGETGAVRELAQNLVDEFFKDVDNSLRELGIGDLGVPKRIKKLARMFYGRADSYSEALDRNDAPALAAALARNIRPDAASWPEAAALAGYVIAADEALATQSLDRTLTGVIEFPAPQVSERTVP